VKNKFKKTASVLLFYLTLSRLTFASNNIPDFVIPGGQSIGVTLFTDGVLVTGVSELVNAEGYPVSPAEEAGLKNGDLIIKANGKKINSVNELKNTVSETKNHNLVLTVIRNGKLSDICTKPVKTSEDNSYSIGVWVKDAASGVGTLTCINPENKTFAALGHGICNAETGELLPLSDGNILKSNIISVKKGEKGIPGELIGSFSESTDVLGNITENNVFGLFGKTPDILSFNNKLIPVGKRDEVKKGKASIYTTLDENFPVEYEIEIIKFSSADETTNKGMVIKITDEKLLGKTGGIVQGMSGSPVIQNGKLVGAVTHVFVNDPTRGYGIFIENMLAEAEKIK